MSISLLIGNLLMVAIAAASLMYSDAVLQRMLTRNLGNELLETNIYPGTIYIKGSHGYSKLFRTSGLESFFEMEAMEEEIISAFGVPAVQTVRQYYRSDAAATPDIIVKGQEAERSLKLSAYTDFEEQIEIISGELYSDELDQKNTIEVVVSESTFVEQNMFIGQEFGFTWLQDAAGKPYRMRVAGVFRNSDSQSPYWYSSPATWKSTCVMNEELFLQLFADPANKYSSLSMEQYIVLDYTKIKGTEAEKLLAVTENYRTRIESVADNFVKFHYEELLKDFVPEGRKLNTTIWVLQVPIFILLASFIFMVSRQMLEMEQSEISVYKSRGAGKTQIIMIYFLRSLMLAGAGLVAGVPLGRFLCSMLGASNSFLEFVQRAALPIEINMKVWLGSAGFALFSVATMVIPVIRYSSVGIVDQKRKKHRAGKRPWWQVIFLDVILIGVSLYAVYTFSGQKAYLSQMVWEGNGLNPLIYISSSLFMIGCGLLVLRIFPLLVKLVFWIGKKWWSPSMYVSFLQIVRTKSNQGFIMVFLVLTVALGIYSAQAARTINANGEERIRYDIGADIVVKESWNNNSQAVADDPLGRVQLVYNEPDYGKYEVLEGVESVTKVLVDDKATAYVNGGKLTNLKLMGIHTKEFGETAWFKEELLPHHWYLYLNTISQNSRALLVSSNFKTKYNMNVGDTLTYTNSDGQSERGIIYGFVDYWPSYAPVVREKDKTGIYQEQEKFLIVGHLAQMQSSWGVTPYEVWIKAKDSTRFIYDFAEESQIKFAVFEDASADLIELKNNPVFQGTNGILTVGFIVVLLLCATGFLIYWILSIQARTLQFGIFRAMGMSMREVLLMLINEQIFITGISIGAGVVVGRLASELFIPLVQIAYSSADQVIPLEISNAFSDFVKLFSVIGVMMVLCMVILGMLISKIKISQALKLGED